jgi:hypothetical protein
MQAFSDKIASRVKIPTLLAVSSGTALAPHQAGEEKSKHPFIGDESRIEAGRKSFVSGFAGCHGPEGGVGDRRFRPFPCRGREATRYLWPFQALESVPVAIRKIEQR